MGILNKNCSLVHNGSTLLDIVTCMLFICITTPVGVNQIQNSTRNTSKIKLQYTATQVLLFKTDGFRITNMKMDVSSL
jgi:multisubunit Na+/H+ antiporter MnhG subunit